MLARLNPPILIAAAITLFIAFPVHELAHAWVADQLGDNTPRRMGRLSLNPLVHLDPIGTLLFFIAGFGWAKPVPVNPYNFRNGPRLGTVIVAAAGPFANLVLALLAAIPFRLELVDVFNTSFPSPAFFLFQFIAFNIFLMLFNLIPVVPLDGSKILRGLAPMEWDGWLSQLEQWGMILLILLAVTGIVGFIIGPAENFLLRSILLG